MRANRNVFFSTTLKKYLFTTKYYLTIAIKLILHLHSGSTHQRQFHQKPNQSSYREVKNPSGTDKVNQ